MRARFRRPNVEGSRWRYGVTRNEQPEPIRDVLIRADDTGGNYVVRRQYVQVEVKGPRGGLKWVSL